MTREEKQNFIEQLNELYAKNQFVFLVQINAVNASNTLKFRASIRQNQSHCVVAKNTLSKIVATNVGLEQINNHFKQQVLSIFTNNPVEVAKLLKEYEANGYSIILGSDKVNILSPSDVKKLATLPTLDVLRGQLLSTILGVHTKTVRVLSESAASLVRLIATRSKN